MDLNKIPANLLSLGALDFGMVVDGSVVIIENTVRHFGLRANAGKTSRECIHAAVIEVIRPVFYARAIIITAYLPIFTLQSVEGRLFKPMAWTVSFALLGALLFSMLIAPVLSGLLFTKGAHEWRNPVMEALKTAYSNALRWAIEYRLVTVGAAALALCFALYVSFLEGVIGSGGSFRTWTKGRSGSAALLAPSTGPTEGVRLSNQARDLLCSFPEVPQCAQSGGAPG